MTTPYRPVHRRPGELLPRRSVGAVIETVSTQEWSTTKVAFLSWEPSGYCYWCRASHPAAVDWAGVPERPYVCGRCGHLFGDKPVAMRNRGEPPPDRRAGGRPQQRQRRQLELTGWRDRL